MRKPRASTLEKRQRILDAAERVMLSDGYAAVTSRRVEAESGLKLHYHFGSLDELFIAIVRRRGELNVRLLAEALASPEPLREWWRLASHQAGSRLLVELTAAANHRPSGDTASPLTPACPRRCRVNARVSFPVATSQNRTAGSWRPAVSRCLPSGVKR